MNANPWAMPKDRALRRALAELHRALGLTPLAQP